ncbi:MAG: Formiminotransferase-cyclodeaminase [Gaiellales bacterium]|nr:Formiminotransferase-cyclodeaminase [Gaiellales bacterium]MDX6544442.1 Formiminotransferase-cyclodeaminase [Gaiellales bacterium]MDX6550707.1 Formiminotransferase-cyclodeaminase [Gaiellales bacterium]
MEQLVTRVASDQRTPAAGSAAAAAGELAAALVIKSARRSRAVWPEAGGAIAQAEALAARLRAISATIESTYETAMEALEAHDEDAIARHLPPAAEAALELARTSADVAELAVEAAHRCDQTHHADVTVAAVLAESAARAGSHLVAINLLIRPDDGRAADAGRQTDRARQAAATLANEQ